MTTLTYTEWKELEDTMRRTVGVEALIRWIEHGKADEQIDNYRELCAAECIVQDGFEEFEEFYCDEDRNAVAALLTEIDPIKHANAIQQLTAA